MPYAWLYVLFLFMPCQSGTRNFYWVPVRAFAEEKGRWNPGIGVVKKPAISYQLGANPMGRSRLRVSTTQPATKGQRRAHGSP